MSSLGPALALVACLAAAFGFALALGVPSYCLVGVAFLSQILPDTFRVGGVLVDTFDVTFGLITLSLLFRGVPRRFSLRRIPHLGLWLVLGGLISAAYSVSPDGAPNMTDAVRIVYQLYRYAFRFVLMYPIACAVMDTPRKFERAMVLAIVAADVFALMAIRQGYAGEFGTGPFASKNSLGAALAVPLVLCLGDVLANRRPNSLHWLSLVSVPLLLRGLMFASSRGAFAGVLVGTTVAVLFMHRGRVRTRLGVLVGLCAVAVVFVLLAEPDLFQRPTIARMFTAVDPGQSTLVWRTTERWPHFLHRAWQYPWLGWGTNVDLELGPSANTPHNGYLSLAVSYGFPVLFLYLVFCAFTLRNIWMASGWAPDPDDRFRTAKIAGGLACILAHNMVDTVIILPFVGTEFWIFVAVTAMLAARARRPATARPRAPARRRALVLESAT